MWLCIVRRRRWRWVTIISYRMISIGIGCSCWFITSRWIRLRSRLKSKHSRVQLHWWERERERKTERRGKKMKVSSQRNCLFIQTPPVIHSKHISVPVGNGMICVGVGVPAFQSINPSKTTSPSMVTDLRMTRRTVRRSWRAKRSMVTKKMKNARAHTHKCIFRSASFSLSLP